MTARSPRSRGRSPVDADGRFEGMRDRELLMLAASCLQKAAALAYRCEPAARERARFRLAMAELDRRYMASELKRLAGPGAPGNGT